MFLFYPFFVFFIYWGEGGSSSICWDGCVKMGTINSMGRSCFRKWPHKSNKLHRDPPVKRRRARKATSLDIFRKNSSPPSVLHILIFFSYIWEKITWKDDDEQQDYFFKRNRIGKIVCSTKKYFRFGIFGEIMVKGQVERKIVSALQQSKLWHG